jgi:hypothetical protein
VGGIAVHAHTNQWRGVGAHADTLLTALGEDSPDARVTRALAPARGALFGMLLGGLCWTAVATVVWAIF